MQSQWSEPPPTFRPGRVVVLALCWMAVTLVGFEELGKPLFKQRLKDLYAIRMALQAYKNANGAYPKATAVTVGSASDIDQAQWIPGLAPGYIAFVPRDPRGLAQSNKQYLYMSDGVDFKVVAHGAEDALWVNKHHADLADPRRPQFAYGVWTTGAASW